MFIFLSHLRRKIYFLLLATNILSTGLFAKIQPILYTDLDVFFTSKFHTPKNNLLYSDYATELSKRGGYGKYKLNALKFANKIKLGVGFIARPDGKFSGNSFFGSYQISYIDLAEKKIKRDFFYNFWNPAKMKNRTRKYSDYLTKNLTRFLWQWELLPYSQEIVTSGQLTNQVLFAYSYSILDQLDFSLAFSYLSLLPKGTMDKQRIDSFKRTDLFTSNMGFFFRPLDLDAKPKFDEELEMSFFFNHTFHFMPKAVLSFPNQQNIGSIEKKNLLFKNNKHIFNSTFGIFYEKKINFLIIENSFLYNHKLTFFPERSKIEKQNLTEKNNKVFAKVTPVSIEKILKKNQDEIENSFSLQFLLPYKRLVKSKKMPAKLTLTTASKFSIEYADNGLWETEKNFIDPQTDAHLPHHYFSIKTKPFFILDARLFDNMKKNFKVEIDYLFYNTASFFVRYDYTFSNYYNLQKLAKVATYDSIPLINNIEKNDHINQQHALKFGFRYSNDYIENIEPYFFFVRSINGKLSSKKNLDFIGVGIKFYYLLSPKQINR